jgi:hypothetical protein
MGDVAAVRDVADACQRHLLSKGFPKAGQALADLTGEQGGGTARVCVIFDNPLQGPVCLLRLRGIGI